MKIAFIGGREIHLLGGIENYMLNLATHLTQNGHEVVVYCESDHNEEVFENGFRVVYRKSIGGRFLCKIILGLTSTLHALCNEKGIEYFHYNAWPPSLWSWIPRLCGRKVLLQGHGHEWKRTKYSPMQQRIMHFMEWLTAKMHRNIILVSDEQRRYFEAHYHRHAATIPTAINLPDPASKDSDIIEREGLERERYFLFLGRLVQDKNPDVLIRAYRAAKDVKSKLVIAGSNNQLPDYVAKLKAEAEGDARIIFTGAVYGADKETLLKHCRAFCIPSTIEGLAITLLEAMSYGRLCIASDIDANREALGSEALWVKAEDKVSLTHCIEEVEANFEALRPMGNANFERVATNFTWERICKLYIDELQSF